MTTRQHFITDVVEHYIKNNKEEYEVFIDIIRKRRDKLSDKKLAKTKDKKSRAEASLPEKLYSILDYALDNPRFLEDGTGKEIRWFLKKYPQFKIPNEY